MRKRLFRSIFNLITCHPWKVVGCALMVAAASLWYAGETVQLNADLDDLVSEELEYHQRYKAFLQEFGDYEYLYVVVDTEGDFEQGRAFLDELGQKLRNLPDLREVTWKVENPTLERGFLLFLPTEDVASMVDLFSRGPFALDRIAKWQELAPLFSGIATVGSHMPASEGEEVLRRGFGLVDALLTDMQKVLLQTEAPSFDLNAFLMGESEEFDGQGFFRNGDLLFLLIMPQKDFTTLEVIAEPLRRVRAAIDETKREFPNINAGLTGRPVLSADELETTDRDMRLATLLALLVVGLLFILFFRSVSRPILSMLSLLIGIAWTFGFIAVTIGELTILSTVFALILVGAAIEYAIHFVARYQEVLAQGNGVEDSLQEALHTSGKANLTSACTTAAAFLTIMWTDFTALAELGLIAAVGILLCLIAMLVVLPAMLLLSDRRRDSNDLMRVAPFALPRLPRLLQHRGALLTLGVVVTLALLPFALQARFDNNLLNLQARGLESVKYEELIIEKSGETTWFAHSIAASREEAIEKATSLRQLPSVRRVDDISRVLPGNQEEKIALLEKGKERIGKIEYRSPTERIDKTRLTASLKKLGTLFGEFMEKAFSAGRIDAVEELEQLREKVISIVQLLEKSAELNPLSELQRRVLEDLHAYVSLLSQGFTPEPITLEVLPQEIRRRFVSEHGKYLLTIYPKENIWDPVALEIFLREIRSVDPNVVGTPIEVHESGRLMRETFARSAGFAFLVILFLVWIDFRSLRFAFLAVLPLVIGMSWLVSLMGLFDIPFNMANFFAIPILIGIGVDSGVHLVHRLQRDRSIAALGTSTAKGVLLTVCANAIGFGMMMIAAHRGLASLGEMMAIGSICCLLAAFFIMPLFYPTSPPLPLQRGGIVCGNSPLRNSFNPVVQRQTEQQYREEGR